MPLAKLNKIVITNVLLSIIIWQVALCQDSNKGGILSQRPEVKGKVYGIIVGVSEYKELPKLNYADKDAIQFFNYLKKQQPNSDTNNLYLFTNSNATRDIIIDKMYELSEKAVEGDKIYIYFSGHGDVEQLIKMENSLLLLSESPKKNYLRKSNSYLDIDIFRTFFKTWSEKKVKVIFICDACRAGNLVGGEEGRKNTIIGLQQSWNNEIKILSCQADEVSLESNKWGGGRGLFSYYLLLGLKGIADKDNNHLITLLELDRYLKEQVGESSKQSQIPFVQGDLKSIMSSSDNKTIAEAKIELKNNLSSSTEAIAARGLNNNLENYWTDSIGFQLYQLFKIKMASNTLIEPEYGSAYDIYKHIERRNISPKILNSMRLELIMALQNSFDELLNYFYYDQYEKFGILEKFKIEKELNACLDLAKGNNIIKNKIMASLLFLDACELAVDIRPGTRDYYSNEKLKKGIDKLQTAIALAPMSPYLYLRLGDYYLYTNQIDKSINSYLFYQKLLPNDEFSYNKLGLGYTAKGNKPLAIECFKKSLLINPSYWQAANNLKIATNK